MKTKGTNAAAWFHGQSFNGGTRDADTNNQDAIRAKLDDTFPLFVCNVCQWGPWSIKKTQATPPVCPRCKSSDVHREQRRGGISI